MPIVAAMPKASVLAGVLPLTGALKVNYGPSELLNCGGVTLNFEDFVQTYERQYSPGSEEYAQRQALFESRVDHITSHNCAEEPWKAQVNHLTDWTEEELQSLRGYKKAYTASAAQSGASGAAQLDKEDDPAWATLPETFSWGHLDAISTPTDQGSCGSCWAYASSAALNAHAEINNNTNRYSVAQIVACTPNPKNCGGNGGCKGATAELAYEYALTNGLVLEAEFPAKPHGLQAECPAAAAAPSALQRQGVASKAVIMPDGAEKHLLPDDMRGGRSMGMLGWTKLPENKELPMVRALVEYGPLAVAVAAGHDWNWYYHGILTPQGCDTKNVISHAVVLFGYGTAFSSKHGEVKYWQIKNSWGRSWGEDGMLRLQRLEDEGGYCGWDKQPELGSGCDGGPKKVWVCGSCGLLYDTVLPMFRM